MELLRQYHMLHIQEWDACMFDMLSQIKYILEKYYMYIDHLSIENLVHKLGNLRMMNMLHKYLGKHYMINFDKGMCLFYRLNIVK
jgi:hypothetical protein